MPDDQLARTNEALNRPWYDPIARVGEASAFVKMPFEATDAANFEFDPATGTVMAYTGSDVDVVIPREIDGVTVTAIDRNAFEACRDYANTETTSDRTESAIASSWKLWYAMRRWKPPAAPRSCFAAV